MPGPIATIGSLHVCSMCSGTVPHVGGPIIGPGAANILINGKPAALMGDLCTCVGPPDVIAQGSASVFFNGVPVVCQGDLTAHGGVITQGEPNVTISTSTPSPTKTMERHKIPFPKITLINRVLGNAKDAIVNQNALATIAPVVEEEEDSKKVTLKTTLAQDQLHLLAKNCTLNRFLMYLIEVFGKDIPSKAYEELYHDAVNNSIPEPTIRVKLSIPYGGKALFYNDKIVQEIWVGEQIIRDAAQKNEQSGELMVVLIEEYGHFIDYLLRNHYADTERQDALRDEGAYFSYKMLELNSIDQQDQYYADATIEGTQHTLIWDYEPHHKGLKDFVSEERRTKDDNFGPFEFYKAGFSKKTGEYAHGDIELKGLSSALKKTGLDERLLISNQEKKIEDFLLKIYFGNWKRDYSQGLDPMIIRLLSNGLAAFAEDNSNGEDTTYNDVVNRFDIETLMSKTIPEKEQVTYKIKFIGVEFWSATFSPVDISVKMICSILEMLAAKEFVYTPLEEKQHQTNANYVQYLEKLEKDFSLVNRDNLGVYVPAEHIDNPVTFKDNNDDNVLLPEFVGNIINTQRPSLHDLNMEYGMKNYIRSASSNGNEPIPAKNRYVNSHVYILHKLKVASKFGGYNNKTCKQELGAALHTLEDFFAHSNYAEIALIKEGAQSVFPWVSMVPGKTDYLRYISDPEYRSKVNKNPIVYNVVKDVVNITTSNQLTTKIPLVTGIFGLLDTVASLLPIVAHTFDYEDRINKRETEKKNERAKKDANGSFYYKDNINSRTFTEVLFLEFLKDMTNEGRDTKEEKDSLSVKTLKEALSERDAVYEKMQEASNSAHEWYDKLPETLKKGIDWTQDQSAKARNRMADYIDEKVDIFLEPFYGVMYNLLQLVASNINDIQVAQASEIERLHQEAKNKTWNLKIGIDPTHTQVAKDDPHHPMHSLSAELAIEAVSKVGTVVFNAWQGKTDYTDVKNTVNDLMKHPAQTNWQSAIVKKWMKNNTELVCKASKPSATIDRLLHVNEEIRDLLKVLKETAQKPAFKKINSYREKLYKDAKGEKNEQLKTFEEKLAEYEKKIYKQENALLKVQLMWDKQFPEPLICRLNGNVHSYKIKKGDTLSEIAKKGNTTEADILELNPTLDKHVIFTGRVIKVPYPIIENDSLPFKD